MTALVDRFHAWLCYKSCFLVIILTLLVFGMEFLIYSEGMFSPTIWTGKCTVFPADNGSPYAKCMIDGKEVTERISIKLFYQVIANHKEITCSADSFKNLACKTEE